MIHEEKRDVVPRQKRNKDNNKKKTQNKDGHLCLESSVKNNSPRSLRKTQEPMRIDTQLVNQLTPFNHKTYRCISSCRFIHGPWGVVHKKISAIDVTGNYQTPKRNLTNKWQASSPRMTKKESRINESTNEMFGKRRRKMPSGGVVCYSSSSLVSEGRDKFEGGSAGFTPKEKTNNNVKTEPFITNQLIRGSNSRPNRLIRSTNSNLNYIHLHHCCHTDPSQ